MKSFVAFISLTLVCTQVLAGTVHLQAGESFSVRANSDITVVCAGSSVAEPPRKRVIYQSCSCPNINGTDTAVLEITYDDGTKSSAKLKTFGSGFWSGGDCQKFIDETRQCH